MFTYNVVYYSCEENKLIRFCLPGKAGIIMLQPLYIVTGAMGHLGNTIVRKLLEQGKEVRGLALPGERGPVFAEPDVKIIRGDVRSPLSLAQLFSNPDGRELIVIHTAGIVTIAGKYQKKVYDVNVTGTKNVVDLCVKHHVKKLVYISSVHAIPEPPKGQVIAEVHRFPPDSVNGLYAKTKAEATQYVLDSVQRGLDASVIHPSGIIGPYDYGHGHLTQLILDYLDGRLTACVRGGYDFVDVRDVADAVIACTVLGKAGECYICSGGYHPIAEVLEMLHEATGKKEVKTILPMWFAKASAPLAEAYYKLRRQPPLYTSYSLYTLGSNSQFSNRRASERLGFVTRPIQETLKDTVEWLAKEHRFKKKSVYRLQNSDV